MSKETFPTENKAADTITIAERYEPLVSILMVVKNGLPSIRRGVESIVSQNYTKIELIIQDGESTDGTIEYINGLSHPAIDIKLFVESDLGPTDAFWRGIIKCNGDLIGFCWSDEMLSTTAVAEVVETFANDKLTACVYGNTFYTDIDGRVFGQSIPGDISLEKYLSREVDPILCSTYFRRSCLEQIGLYSRTWERNIDTMELWARVALGHKITYINRYLSYYAVHTASLSNRDFNDDECFIHLRISFIHKFCEEAGLTKNTGFKSKLIIGNYLFIAKLLLDRNQKERALKWIKRAAQISNLPDRFVSLIESLTLNNCSYNYEMLKYNLSVLDKNFMNKRVLCYGAGNDFKNLIKDGLLQRHIVIAVIDDIAKEGSVIDGVETVLSKNIKNLDFNVVYITSSSNYTLFAWNIRELMRKFGRVEPVI